jgi:hypothetical protein
VPSDVRGYDRLQYTDFDELSEKVAALIENEFRGYDRVRGT